LKYDITIIGGGMVGLTMAVSLSDSDLKVLLIEKQDLNQVLDSDLFDAKVVTDDQFDVRVSAISPGNRAFLSRLGAWQNIPKQRQAAYEHMRVWDGDGTGKIEFSAAKIAQPDLGVIVENRMIQLALLKQIKDSRNVNCEFGHELDSIQTSDKSAELILTNGQSYQSKLVIGADGAHSVVKKLVGIDSNENDYSQIAYVANVKTELSHQNTAWQRFTPFGPVAFLPLANENLCSIVWSLDTDKANKLKDISTQEFVEKLQQAFESKLGQLKAVSKHYGFPLIKRHSQSYLSHRIALVGDAAHTIHPLAGQGVNLGFQDVASLAKLILQLDSQERDYGLVANLRPFERERKTENMLMQNAMSGFKHLFANQSMPVTLLRNFAMSALNDIPMVKETIIKKAMGI
jgi:2-octaprenylphenol hydroxylase